MQNLLDKLKGLLEQDERLVVDGDLLKNKIIELALQLDPSLIKLLLSHSVIKKHFFQEVEGVLVFDTIKFQKFVSNKAFLPDSYTSFKNKIGLVADNDFITESKDVVLVWPYKDCVLEGGQSRDDAKRTELFWNETLASDEIDRLISPKVITNFKRFKANEIEDLKDISKGENLIIKGNNLLSLYSLKKVFTNKIRLIYIDPPYNTGNDSFNYNDSFNHSAWLVFMKNRLEVAKDLLADNGSIFISINDEEQAYLKVLCDEIFGRNNFICNIIWHSKYTTSNDAKLVSTQHENILFYAKNKEAFKINLLDRTSEMDKAYTNPDNDKRGPWKATPLHAKSGNSNYVYTFKNGIQWTAPSGRFPRFSKNNIKKLDEENRITFGRDGKATPSVKSFLSEVKQGKTVGSVWSFDEVGSTHKANEELASLLGKGVFNNPKSVELIKKIIKIGTESNSIILDFFAGSGTTGQAVLEMNAEDGGTRQFILCEQMDYVDNITTARIQKVIEGNSSGSFVYCELKKLNQYLIDKVLMASNQDELIVICDDIISSDFIFYKVNKGSFSSLKSDFNSLNFEEQKKLLLELLDKNQMYLPLSEIDDINYQVSQTEKNLNTSFYHQQF